MENIYFEVFKKALADNLATEHAPMSKEASVMAQALKDALSPSVLDKLAAAYGEQETQEESADVDLDSQSVRDYIKGIVAR